MTSYGNTYYSNPKDPFASPALPKAFYHPTRSREVDSKIAIAVPERDEVHERSRADIHFLNESGTYLPSALPHLNLSRAKQQHGSSSHHNISDRSGDHFQEVWPYSEQPSAISAQTDISPFTSVSAETEQVNIEDQSKAKCKKSKFSDKKDMDSTETPVKSVLQKYIDRFRHCEPKSRTERAKEGKSSYNEFWWMNSSSSSQVEANSPACPKQSSGRLLAAGNVTQVELPHARKLTKEAVMELDQETSKLQNKADQILSRSQLSLASSGPIVSTQGLGSSTTLSDYSMRSDSQAPYRPAFVNIRENKISDSEESFMEISSKQHQVLKEVSSPSGDILAKWRLRRKMEETKSSSSRIAPQSLHRVARNKEMNVRLEEFRMKLISQRAVVTQEEIQYERQKMNMLIEEETEDCATKVKKQDPKDTKEQLKENHDVDPILARLKGITSSSGVKGLHSSNLPNVHNENLNQNSSIISKGQKEQFSNDNPVLVDSNINNACSKSELRSFSVGNSDDMFGALDRNNTAISENADGMNNPDENHVIDKFDSVVICDTKNKFVNLKEDNKKDNKEEICIDCKRKTKTPSSHKSNVEASSNNIQLQKENLDEAAANQSSNEMKNKIPREKRSSLQEKQVYRQYLVAEKPNIETRDKPKGNLRDEDEISEKSERDTRRSKPKKRDKRNRQNSGHNKRDETEGSMSADSDAGSRASRHSNKSFSKLDTSHHGSDMSLEYEQSSSKEQQKAPLHSKKRSPSEKIDNHHAPSTREDKSLHQKQISGDKSKSPRTDHQRIKRAVVETVADHLFDGTSVISSVDSWASLFPQSPAPSRSMHDSELATPSPFKRNVFPAQETPPHGSSLLTTDNEAVTSESDNEFEDDPLLSLLRKQRQDYVKKLEAIESALLKVNR